MPVNAIAMPFSFAAAIDSSSLIDPPRLETGVRLAICDSLSLATVVLLNDLGASALESQNRKPDPGSGFLRDLTERSARFYTEENLGRRVYTEPDTHC